MVNSPSKAKNSKAAGAGGGFILLVVIVGLIKAFGGGNASKPNTSAINTNLHPKTTVLPSRAVVQNHDDSFPVAPQSAKNAPSRSPQEALGWNKSKCMYCQKQRSRQEASQFSDSDGFGFCSDCGKCANAFALHRKNVERNGGSSPQVEQLAKVYMQSITDRYSLNQAYLIAFFEWGNGQAWRDTWHNVAVLTKPGYSGGR